MKTTVISINSFAKTDDGGNLAGVVLDSDNLKDEEMQAIAKEVGYSETAFISKSEVADFKVRFFTPSDEVELCGHATIACFYVLFKKGVIKKGIYTQETKAGILSVTVNEDASILMEQSVPKFLGEVPKKEIAFSLGIKEDDIVDSLPIELVSTGLPDLIVPVKSLNILNNLTPNFEEIANLSKKYECVGYHVFTEETLFNNTAHTRNFSPLYDINEESATGTANGALACYLYNNNVLKDLTNLTFEQGYSMNSPSEIKASLVIEDNKIKSVLVGGCAMNLKELTIEI